MDDDPPRLHENMALDVLIRIGLTPLSGAFDIVTYPAQALIFDPVGTIRSWSEPDC